MPNAMRATPSSCKYMRQAGRGEGLAVDALYLHSLRGDRRDSVPHTKPLTDEAVRWG